MCFEETKSAFFQRHSSSPRKIFKARGPIANGCMFKGGAILGKLYSKPLMTALF